jgi:hypothetical protein
VPMQHVRALAACGLTVLAAANAFSAPREKPQQQPQPASQQQQQQQPSSKTGESNSLTIYSTAQPGAVPPELYRPVPGGPDYGYGQYGRVPGYAVVRQERELERARGRGELRFVDVAALIDPTTVRFESVTDPTGTTVLEQNFQFDLVGQQKLLQKYLDRDIVVEQVHGDSVETVSGRLLSAQGGLILQGSDGQVRSINSWSGIRFPELPGGLITRPTLVWDVEAAKGGKHRTRVSYQTQGITWWADYNLTFAPGANANRGTLDVAAWVSILNQSGGSYPDAKLKLIAGDVQRAPQPSVGYRADMAKVAMEAQAPGFEEKAFFEYHLYTLGRPTTLPDNSTKQIELFPPARGVPADKVLVYYGLAGFGGFFPNPVTDRGFGQQSNPKVDVYLRFQNGEKQGLGVPLPSGRIRVNQVDPADGSLEFIGEDVIDHTPKDEEVLIRLGNAFDVVGERRQVDFRVDTARRTMEEKIEIELRNHKEEPVDVLVKENLFRWVNWEIVESSHKWEKVDARTVHFPVKVDASGTLRLSYRVRYSW